MMHNDCDIVHDNPLHSDLREHSNFAPGPVGGDGGGGGGVGVGVELTTCTFDVRSSTVGVDSKTIEMGVRSKTNEIRTESVGAWDISTVL